MAKKTLTEATFNIDGGPPSVRGYTDGSDWNGFEVPLVDRGEAMRIANWFVRHSGHDGDEDMTKLHIEMNARGKNRIDLVTENGETYADFFQRRDGLWNIQGGFTWNLKSPRVAQRLMGMEGR